MERVTDFGETIVVRTIVHTEQFPILSNDTNAVLLIHLEEFTESVDGQFTLSGEVERWCSPYSHLSEVDVALGEVLSNSFKFWRRL